MKTSVDRFILLGIGSGIWVCAFELQSIKGTPVRAYLDSEQALTCHIDNKAIVIANDESQKFWVYSDLVNESGALNVQILNGPKTPVFIDSAQAAFPVLQVDSKEK